VTGRCSYVEVGAAVRQAHERAAAATGLTGRDWRVLSAIVALVASYSRLVDRLTAAQVADAAGCDPRDARKSLARLRDLGIIVREESRGRRPAVTGLPAAQPGVAAPPVETSEPGVAAPLVGVGQPGVESTANPGYLHPPTREDFREESSARASEAPPPGLAGGQPAALEQPDEPPSSWDEVVEQIGGLSEPMRTMIQRAADAHRQLELRVDDAGDELARRDAQRRRGEMSGSGATARPTAPPGDPLMRPSAAVASTGGPA